MKQKGFTLAELVLVIAIMGIIAASVVVFLRPAIDAYLDTRRRVDLSDMADTALRRIGKDIRAAVPRSIRQHSATCTQFVPTIAGGRYRRERRLDGGTLWVDSNVPTAAFDVLTPLTGGGKDDWVVIGNQNGGDVYSGASRGQISSIAVPAATAGLHRVTLTADTQFPVGYDKGRFVIVPNAEQSVFYKCVGTTLYRQVTDFGGGADNCTKATGSVVANEVLECEFIYDPNKGDTEQNGFVWMRLKLGSAQENISLSYGVHVDNAP